MMRSPFSWLLLVACSLALALFYFVQQEPVYESTSQFLVVKNRPEIVSSGGNTSITIVEDFVTTQVVVLKPKLVLPTTVSAQTKEIQDAIDARLATAKFVLALEDRDGGFRGQPYDPRKEQHIPATIGSTSAALRTLRYLGVKVPNPEKHAAFVMSCYDPATGGFGEIPKSQPSVYSTAVGVMAASEIGIPKEKFAKAMDFLHTNVKSYEDARIAAAAVEAWGVKECPFPVDNLFKVLGIALATGQLEADDSARRAGGMGAMAARLGKTIDFPNRIYEVVEKGRRADGAWGKLDAKSSDLESTYRVMRGLYLIKAKPTDVAKLREFLRKCRNDDGGYGISPGQTSAIGPTYFATIVSHWLDEMEK